MADGRQRWWRVVQITPWVVRFVVVVRIEDRLPLGFGVVQLKWWWIRGIDVSIHGAFYCMLPRGPIVGVGVPTPRPSWEIRNVDFLGRSIIIGVDDVWSTGWKTG